MKDEFKEFRLKIRCSAPPSAELFTFEHSKDNPKEASFTFLSDQAIRYCYWKKSNERKHTESDSLVKKVNVTDKDEIFTCCKYIHSLEQSYLIISIGNMILKWKVSDLQQKAYTAYETYHFLKLSK